MMLSGFPRAGRVAECYSRPVMQDSTPISAESAEVRLVITALSGVVFLLIAFVVYFLPGATENERPSVLASLNAFLNSCATVFLLAGFYFIRKKNIVWHRRSMLAAFGVSSLFLLTYLLHHVRVGSVPFLGQGAIRVFYFSLLIPHIILAAMIVPMALLTIYRGWTDRIVLHRRIARITLPIWLFVTTSGVALYFMLYHL